MKFEHASRPGFTASQEIGKEIRSYKRDVEAGVEPKPAADDTEVLIPYSDDYPDVMKDSFGHIWEIRVCQADVCRFYDDDCALQCYPPSGNPGPASFIFQGTPDPTLLCEMCYDADEVQKDGVWYALHREEAADER